MNCIKNIVIMLMLSFLYLSSISSQLLIPLCTLDDCNSNGLCVGNKLTFTCICNVGYSGLRCEIGKRNYIYYNVYSYSVCWIILYRWIKWKFRFLISKTTFESVSEPLCNSILQCSNNGICIGTQKLFTCLCNINWNGPNCQFLNLIG